MRHKAPPPLDAPEKPDTSPTSYAYVYGGWSGLAAQGGTSTLTIASPALPPGDPRGDHSVSQTWSTAGSGSSRQSVEVGWNVDPGLYHGSTEPHLFIQATSSPGAGCYNNLGPGCLTWLPSPGAALAVGAALPSSTVRGTQHELTLTVMHYKTSCLPGRRCTPSWVGWGIWASIDGGPTTMLGTYANSAFGLGPMASGNDRFVFGGEVFDHTAVFTTSPHVAMGEGVLAFGAASYGSTAYHRDSSYYDSSWASVYAGTAITVTNSAYAGNTTAPPGAPTWKNWFYFGNWARPRIAFRSSTGGSP